jgi:protein-S-isoprenylcysteine O-methyltransferase Ste14
MFQLVAAYLCLVLFFSLEFLARKGRNAKKLGFSDSDHRSTIYIGLCFFVVLFLSAILNTLRVGRFYNPRVANIALVMMSIGLAIRVWAMLVLRKYYTRTLITTDHQRIIRSGPYRLIRHPGYLGTCLVWSSAGLAMQNTDVFICATVLILLAYFYRIKNEEHMLVRQFGKDYQDYINHSWRLIPFLW